MLLKQVHIYLFGGGWGFVLWLGDVWLMLVWVESLWFEEGV